MTQVKAAAIEHLFFRKTAKVLLSIDVEWQNITQITKGVDMTYAHVHKTIELLVVKGLALRQYAGRSVLIKLSSSGERLKQLFCDILVEPKWR